MFSEKSCVWISSVVAIHVSDIMHCMYMKALFICDVKQFIDIIALAFVMDQDITIKKEEEE